MRYRQQYSDRRTGAAVNTHVFNFKTTDLLSTLEARRTWALALDAKQKQDHARAERAALLKFRAALTAARKWDYAKLKANNFEVSPIPYQEKPQCPDGFVERLDRAIASVASDGRKRWTISHNGQHSYLHYLLTYDAEAKPDICA